MLENASQTLQISKISWGACPRTPLVPRGLRPLASSQPPTFVFSATYFKTCWNPCSYISSDIANSSQSAVSKFSYLLQYLVNKEVTRLRLHRTLAVQVWFLKCRSTTKRIFHRENEGPDSFLYEQTGERREDAECGKPPKKMLTLSNGQSSEELGFWPS